MMMPRDFLENIKHEVDDNELIAQDFGEMRGSQWGAGKIVLANGVALIGKGKGASARGLRHHESRPDLVVIDDLLKDAEADSPDQCAKALWMDQADRVQPRKGFLHRHGQYPFQRPRPDHHAAG